MGPTNSWRRLTGRARGETLGNPTMNKEDDRMPKVRRAVRAAPLGVGLALAGLVLAVAGCRSSERPGGDAGSNAYTITVYYTAVESFHTGAARSVRGSLTPEGAPGNDVLGTWPTDFVQAVMDEGTGRITSGPHAGRYLNWSHDIGYWLDAVPANAYGGRLVPFRTAAADLNVLPRGTRFRLVAPLVQDDGTPLDAASAGRFLAAEWEVEDQFTPGLGGANHLDLHIGEEDRAGFTETSPLYTTLANVRISVQ
jgi:hypothetical protein